ncbi:unnamed protein product [Rotaria magnacalcarata]|uniref:Uncharacterized protein n=1 Tax=Rotaria magnacalcarata TaxID=392030 RepID=A0A816QZP7_9BILA|nr:unnamed protein product [Rotaria magnacalcarata]
MKTILPIVAQYFSDVGVKHGILEFIEQQDDSAGGLFANIKYELEPHELELQKLTSLGSDNTNVNVDPKHSVFSLFKELIPLLVQVIAIVTSFTTQLNTDMIIYYLMHKLLF